jgi:PIN domain nuclease of toxin-antitoxin system
MLMPELLLDTHAWLWLVQGEQQFSDENLALIEQAAREARLRVSSISIWEVAMLEVKGRIALSLDCHTWVRQALAAPGLDLLTLEPDILIDSSRLPGTFHGDPADRIIVATARARGACLLTRDGKILEYAARGFVAAKAI